MSRSIISVDSSSNFGGHTTITSALRNNVTIYVHKGTYTENLDFTGLTGIIIYCLPGVVLSGTITAQTTNKIIYAERKIYSVLLNQTGTNAPTVINTSYNNIGSIVWTYEDVNEYKGTLNNAFLGEIYGKIYYKIGSTTDYCAIEKGTKDYITLIFVPAGVPADLEGSILLEFEVL